MIRLYIENIVIDKPLVDPIILLSEDVNDWNNNEKEKLFLLKKDSYLKY